MGRERPPRRFAWENRFRVPSAEDLLAPFEAPVRELIEVTRSRLLAVDGATERIRWLGVPWRWSFVYDGPEPAGRARAYLIPEPGRPQLALPIGTDVFREVSLRRLPRFIRDGFVYAPQVGGVRWAQWVLTSRSQVDQLASFVEQTRPLVGA